MLGKGLLWSQTVKYKCVNGDRSSDDECGYYEEGEESDDDERENVDDLDSNNGNR